MRNRVFFPRGALDRWLEESRAEVANDELLLKSDGRRYRIIEAVRVLREVTGLEDANELVGKVKSCAFLGELGAEILESSMVLGDNAYDVVPGFVGAPLAPPRRERNPTPPQPLGRTREAPSDLVASFRKNRGS